MQTSAESKSKGFFRSSPSTAFDQYLQDIQKLPLISDAEEERRLARRAQAGDEKAAERLVTANLRFVISYVKKYQGHGLDLSELVAIGRAQTVLSQVLKRDPTDHEIGRLLEETPEAVRSAKQMSATEISLDAPIDRSDREACTLGERFAGVDGAEIEEVTDFHLMREFIDRVFRKYLTPRERKILHLYYGLEQGSDAMTLEKIGALMGVTRERIRQIRERAFEKLRESPDGAALSGFWTAD